MSVGTADSKTVSSTEQIFAEETALLEHDRAQSKLMIVDDEPINIKVVQKYLECEGYRNFVSTTEPREVMELIRNESPDTILLDIMMPNVSGLEILRAVRNSQKHKHIPVIILTAASDSETKRLALNLGATDFLGKPVDANDLMPRVRNALVVKAHHDQLVNYAEQLTYEVRMRTAELTRNRLEVVHCLARAAEYRDNDTGRHIIRVGRYVGILARQMNLSEEMVELMELASPLHDVGKIGIPDAILLKPGKLTPEEFEIMKSHSQLGMKIFDLLGAEEKSLVRKHTNIGQKIFKDMESPLLVMAGRIAMTHHERWDGKGYPNGLAGDQIPVESRITAVADVFDALSSHRPYKSAIPLDKCFAMIKEESGEHFDPKVVDAFFEKKDAIAEVHTELADSA